MTLNRWTEMIENNPEHSTWYVERFRAMAAAGDDLVGEARLVDAMAARGSRVLDAGCGPGRVGGHLARLGHTVVGVDLDPVLIEAARHDHPGPTWLVGDLAELDLCGPDLCGPDLSGPDLSGRDPAGRDPATSGTDGGSEDGTGDGFDIIVSAGNVMTFLAPQARRPVLSRLAAHLRQDGRMAIGFGAGRDYPFEEFFADVEHAGLTVDLKLSSWDIRPFTDDSGFLVAILSHRR